MGAWRPDLSVGDVFGKWTVIGSGEDAPGVKERVYECRCVCGNIKKPRKSHLISGVSLSCGRCSYSTRPSRETDPKKLIWSRSIPEPNSGCWLWEGFIDRDGYGQTTHDKQLGTNKAHRISYTAFCGPIPDGLQIDHLCRVRCCVNPDHLEAVTIKVNSLRSMSFAAKNSRKAHCINGHPLSGDNVHIGKRGKRSCRECWRARTAAYKQRKGRAA